MSVRKMEKVPSSGFKYLARDESSSIEDSLLLLKQHCGLLCKEPHTCLNEELPHLIESHLPLTSYQIEEQTYTFTLRLAFSFNDQEIASDYTNLPLAEHRSISQIAGIMEIELLSELTLTAWSCMRQAL
jgi:hypothetical protein